VLAHEEQTAGGCEPGAARGGVGISERGAGTLCEIAGCGPKLFSGTGACWHDAGGDCRRITAVPLAAERALSAE